MASFTVRGFAKAFGLKGTREDQTISGIFLKLLSKRGLAPVVGKIKPATGRPALVYNLDEKVAKSLKVRACKVVAPPRSRKSVKAKTKPKSCEVWEILEITLRKTV